MIIIKDLTKEYKKKSIFKQANVRFEKNRINYLIGANGSGKTSLIKCLLQLETYEGEITFDSEKVSQKRGEIGVVFDDTPFYTSQTGMANLYLLSKGKIDKDLIDVLATELMIDKLLGKKVKFYSYGEKKKLALLLALVSRPSFLILDEISNGLDYDTMSLLQKRLPGWAETTTIIVTGHHYEFYRTIVDHLFVIRDQDIHEAHDFDKEVKELGPRVE